jgi:ABC-type multidrug transport system ATPase subunit
MSILVMENLTCSFGVLVAVDSLSLRIETGETYVFLSPNGTGKSTTIKMLTTLLPPTGIPTILN